MQKVGYGKIEHLLIVKGEPVVHPPPRLYRHHRLTGPNQERREQSLPDFLLKQQILRLFASLDRIQDGIVATLQIRDGLPYDMLMEEPSRT